MSNDEKMTTAELAKELAAKYRATHKGLLTGAGAAHSLFMTTANDVASLLDSLAAKDARIAELESALDVACGHIADDECRHAAQKALGR